MIFASRYAYARRRSVQSYLTNRNNNSRDTFLGVHSWLTDVRSLANPELVVSLVGNKNDRSDEREVSYLEASRFAQENGKNFIYIRHCCTLKLSLHDIYRDDVPGSKRADRRCGGGDVFQMRTIDFKQNRDR